MCFYKYDIYTDRWQHRRITTSKKLNHLNPLSFWTKFPEAAYLCLVYHICDGSSAHEIIRKCVEAALAINLLNTNGGFTPTATKTNMYLRYCACVYQFWLFWYVSVTCHCAFRSCKNPKLEKSLSPCSTDNQNRKIVVLDSWTRLLDSWTRLLTGSYAFEKNIISMCK